MRIPKNKTQVFLIISLLFSSNVCAQAESEIQVYASPTAQKNSSLFELHSNYTFEGPRYGPLPVEPDASKTLNLSLEFTHGITNNFELGFYIFTALKPNGEYQYMGSHIRPRIAVPDSWHWPVGASLSVEFGIFRQDKSRPFYWEGEIRPIVDKSFGNLYLSLNPNVEFILTGYLKHWGLSPQFKTVYTIKQKFGLGFEYYASLGNFNEIESLSQEEHLLGPMIDLYIDPKWEINAGYLFGLTNISNQQILKVVLGRRIGL